MLMSTASTVRCLRHLTLSLALSSSSNSSSQSKQVFVTEWGCEAKDAQASIFYFGGTPSSATHEVPLHSIATRPTEAASATDYDIYRQKGIHLIYIDKPGIGGTEFDVNFSIRNDWPRIVSQVADHILGPSATYGVIGVSNGGPYMMACLTASDETIRRRVTAAASVVGVSDVWASGYFGWRHPSGIVEGIINTLPIALAGPCTWMAMQGAKRYIQLRPNTTAISKLLGLPTNRSNEINELLSNMISDSSKHFGRGSQLDCQQSLSPMWARPSQDSEDGLLLSADTAYRRIQVPVALWYGRQDSTIPMITANWLVDRLPNCTKHVVDGTHPLYFQQAAVILDDLLNKMKTAEPVATSGAESSVTTCAEGNPSSVSGN